VSRVSRNDDGLAPSFGYSGGKAAACGGFTNSTLASDKNPMKTLLINDVLEGTCEFLLHQCNNNTLSDITYLKIFNIRLTISLLLIVLQLLE